MQKNYRIRLYIHNVLQFDFFSLAIQFHQWKKDYVRGSFPLFSSLTIIKYIKSKKFQMHRGKNEDWALTILKYRFLDSNATSQRNSTVSWSVHMCLLIYFHPGLQLILPSALLWEFPLSTLVRKRHFFGCVPKKPDKHCHHVHCCQAGDTGLIKSQNAKC